MQTLNNVHEQFAEFFKAEKLKPFASLVLKKLGEGHICLDLKEILNGEIEFPSLYHSLSEMENDLIKEPLVSTSIDNKQPFVLFKSKLYLQRYFVYETIILKRIQVLINSESVDFTYRIELINKHREFIASLFSSDDSREGLSADERIDWQLVATILGLLNNFTIITGGPGTGKTTTVSKLLELLKRIDPNIRIGLAAPTGKAAMRLAESLQGDQPTTIHRMLKTIYGSIHFKHNQQNPLKYDIVIIDEASMIDVALFAKLLDAIGPETRLILLGDKDQLSSVEAGSLFRDLCQTQEKVNSLSSNKIDLINSFIANNEAKLTDNFMSDKSANPLSDHIIELKRSRRFDSTKGIGKFSRAIISNNSVEIEDFLKSGYDEQIHIDTKYSPDIFREFVKSYEAYIQEDDIRSALNKFNKIRVLCAVREGKFGLYHINTAIETLLNAEGLIDSQTEFYMNRPIIITKNYYDLGLFNGDIGILRPDSNNILMAWFEDSEKQLKAVLPQLIVESETVYAMTIHKSQGSEYDEVLIVLPDHEGTHILTRELLYTAVTRAKLKVIIQSSENILLSTIDRTVKRASGIKDRFNDSIQNDLWACN
ncbi:exodeoxyribonuclease V subunit alpha [Albibacterium bauzanense]|uniref:RecBCD enzyme subunit RecD n=1 Tax=Albibacterium bauzanense TaxID=653929 RepID=A0A4R1M5U0_9SPHI|nr:exodeoxyribonuclease V subunit alpha [Albibacterium bauzanense]TCK85113.1 DNA helicase/exodeoxyribonuclease V alpha subunit [Albibacterium bauzanense]